GRQALRDGWKCEGNRQGHGGRGHPVGCTDRGFEAHSAWSDHAGFYALLLSRWQVLSDRRRQRWRPQRRRQNDRRNQTLPAGVADQKKVAEEDRPGVAEPTVPRWTPRGPNRRDVCRAAGRFRPSTRRRIRS